MQFTPEDPASLGIGGERGALGGSFIFAGSGNFQLWVSALRAGSVAGIRMEGIFQGQPVNERIEILPWPYSLGICAFSGQVLAQDNFGSLILETKLEGTLPPAPGLNTKPSPLARMGIRISDPSVAATLDSRLIDGAKLSLRFKAIQPGRTTVERDYGFDTP